MPDLITVLGGREAVGLVVEDLYVRIGEDPLLAPMFAGYDVFRIQRHMHDFLVAAVGGSSAMTGRSLDRAHVGLGITDEMFDRVAGHLVAAFRAHGVAAEHTDAVVDIVATTRPAVVTVTDRETGGSTPHPAPGASPPAAPASGRPAEPDQAFGRYLHLTSVVNCWRAIAGRHGGEVVVDATSIACRVPALPGLNQAIVLDAGAVDQVLDLYRSIDSVAIWTRDVDASSAGKVAAAGFARARRTTAMLIRLPELTSELGPVSLSASADPDVVAALNGEPAELVARVPGVTTYHAADGSSGLLLYRSGTDAMISHLVTAREVRTRGRATSVLRQALLAERQRGARTATLQATPLAAGLCQDLGFRTIGSWQQWVRHA